MLLHSIPEAPSLIKAKHHFQTTPKKICSPHNLFLIFHYITNANKSQQNFKKTFEIAAATLATVTVVC